MAKLMVIFPAKEHCDCLFALIIFHPAKGEAELAWFAGYVRRPIPISPTGLDVE